MRNFQYQFVEHEHGAWLPMHDGLWRDYLAKDNSMTAACVAEDIARREFDGNGMDAEEFFRRIAVREVRPGGIKEQWRIYNITAQELIRFQAEEVIYEARDLARRGIR